MVEIKVPSVGESITEVIVSQWHKAEGSAVKKDEPLVSLETDKVNVDVVAPVSGTLTKVLKPNSATATVGEVIGHIEEGAQASAGATPAPPSPSPAATPSPPSAPAMSVGQPQGEARVMPAAQRAMEQGNVPLQNVTPTGPGGRVLKEDVLRASPHTPAPPPSPQAPPASATAAPTPHASNNAALEEVVPMSPMRRRIAERLVHVQQTAAILTTFAEVDMSFVMALRKQHQDTFSKKHGVKLGFMSFFVKASIDALGLYPEINAEIRGNDIVYHNYYDIGVAVGTDKGLVVPVLRKAEMLSFAEIEQAIGDFANRANAGKLKLDELQGGTFTITNGGVYGSLMSTPIINPPQSGILGMHGIIDRPIGVNGQVVLRPMMYIALSYDHRIVDGRGAVSFLRRIKQCLEEPARMLLEV